LRRSAGLSALIVIALAGTAVADDETEATELFDKGRELFKAGDYEQACPLFERSNALVPMPGTELNIALCAAALGKLVEANKLLDVLAEKIANKQGQEKRHALVLDAKEKLAKRIPTLAITVPEGAKRVRVDGEAVSIAVPVPVNPGEHVIEAEGAERKQVTVKEGEALDVALVATAVAPPPVETPEPNKWRKRIPFTLAATGSALVAGALFTGIAVLGKKNEGLDRCSTIDGQLICDEEANKIFDSARTLSHVSTTMFVSGLALGGVAAWMYYKGWHKSDQTLTGWVTGSSAGVAFGGSW
jgi:hypothetical protein